MTGRTHKLCGKLCGSMTFVGLSMNQIYNHYEKLVIDISKASNADGFIGLELILDKLSTSTYWLTAINCIIMLVLIRIIAQFTSVFPDFDQNADTIPYKEAIPARIINKTLKLFKAHHRSRQTHSIDLTLIFGFAILFGAIQFTGTNSVTTIFAIGLTCGLVSHIISDMFNSTGVYPVFWAPKKIAFVPKKVNSLLLSSVGLLIIFMSSGGAVIFKTTLALAICIASSLIGGTLIVIAICCRGMTFTTGGQWEEMFYKAIHIADCVVTIIACLACFI